jgi:predicted aconitase with swiveling domain
MNGRVLVDGSADGPILATRTPLSLWGGLDVGGRITFDDDDHTTEGA